MAITLHGTDGIDSPDFNATGSVVPANGMYLPSANTLAWTTNSTRNMTLDASGNFYPNGNATQALGGASNRWSVVYGSVFSDGSTSNSVLIDTSGTTARLSPGSVWTVQTFYTGGSERARIDSSGNLLVGMTVQANNAKLSVFSDNTTPGGIAVASNNSLFRQIYLTNTGTVLQFWNGSNQANLSAAGAWTNASDARLKKDIVDIKYGLNTVLQSKPRSFNRIDVAGEFIGFIAQELKKIMPEVVFGSDAEGDQYTVDYASMVAVAFKAIQELTQRLEALEAK